MKRILLAVAVGLSPLVAFVALADVTPSARLSSSARITHGDWQQLPDAGFSYTVCGHALTAGGAKVYTFDVNGGEPIGPCEVCAPGSWASAPATCVAQWKSNRGL